MVIDDVYLFYRMNILVIAYVVRIMILECKPSFHESNATRVAADIQIL